MANQFKHELTVAEAAQLLHYKESTVRQKLSQGKIPFVKHGPHTRILREQIQDQIQVRQALFGQAQTA